jgi:hypothetical protein
VDAGGNIYCNDTFNNTVRKITPDGNLTTIVRTGKAGAAGDNQPALQAQPITLTAWRLTPPGNLDISDSW